MGFTFNGRHSDEFGVAVTIRTLPYIASRRRKVIDVMGRDGQVIFEDGYNNIIIDIICKIGDYSMTERRKRGRYMAAWLSNTGKLVFDHEKDIEYNVVSTVNDMSATILSSPYVDEFSIKFECEPYQHNSFYNDGLTWDDLDSSWPYTDIPWNGYERKFNVTSGQTIDVVNAGTYKNRPIIILTGAASLVNLGDCSYKNLSGTVYIDCKNRVVYSLSGTNKINKITNFSGAFPELKPGSNRFTITGTITNLNIEFDYKNTYL